MLTLEHIRKVVVELAVANHATLALLFGSFARGTATRHSDVDLIFVEETDLRFLDRIGRYFDPLVDQLKTGVEVLVYTPFEFEGMSDGLFLQKVLKEGAVLYESGKK